MNIVGEKVLLRAIELEDQEILLSIINNPGIEHSLGGWSFPLSNLNQRTWIENQEASPKILRCMIEDRGKNGTLGTAILSEIDYKNGNAEIHIKLLDKAQGKGFGTDTINTLVTYAFEELRLKCIYAQINSYNTPSLKLFSKCKFVEEGVLRKRIYKKGNYHDVFILSIINE